MLLDRYRIDSADNLKARQIQTQVQVLRRVIVVAVTTVALAVALLTFPEVRAAGAGLLASAGIVGLVAGLAAGPSPPTCWPACRSPSASASGSTTSWWSKSGAD